MYILMLITDCTPSVKRIDFFIEDQKNEILL